jgi:hypothetical protein
MSIVQGVNTFQTKYETNQIIWWFFLRWRKHGEHWRYYQESLPSFDSESSR